MIPPKETNEVVITYLKEIEIYELSDEELGITLLRKLREHQNQTNKTTTTKPRQVNKIRKSIREQNQKFDKKIATIKNKRQTIKKADKNLRV